MSNLVEAIKIAALEAVENTKPVAITIGVVYSIEPLNIIIEQKSILEEDELLLTKNVTDYWVDMTVDHITEDDATLDTSHSHPNTGEASFKASHTHSYKGKKTFKIHNALKVGDSVMLMRIQGDQQYIVLDKVINP